MSHAKALVQRIKVALSSSVAVANLRENDMAAAEILIDEVELSLIFRRHNPDNPNSPLLLFLNYSYGPISGSVLLS